MRRGELVTIALQGDYGKPRPALIIQADQFSEHTSVTVLPITSTEADIPLLRVAVSPETENGLTRSSYVMIDKTMTVKRNKLGDVFGRLGVETLVEIDRRLAVFLGIAK